MHTNRQILNIESKKIIDKNIFSSNAKLSNNNILKKSPYSENIINVSTKLNTNNKDFNSYNNKSNGISFDKKYNNFDSNNILKKSNKELLNNYTLNSNFNETKTNVNCQSKLNSISKVNKTIMDMSSSLNTNIKLNSNYMPVCLSPSREHFDYKSYFLDVSLNKKSVVNSNVFKNYNEESLKKQIKDKITSKLNKENFANNKEAFINDANSNNISFIELNDKYLNKRNINYKCSLNNTLANEDKLYDLYHNSFESYLNGFKNNNRVKPSYAINSKNISLKLKSLK